MTRPSALRPRRSFARGLFALVAALSLAALASPSLAVAATHPHHLKHAKTAKSKPTATVAAASTSAPQTAIFAMGCFWSAETAFEGLPGVLKAVTGYSGGHQDHPTYEQVGEGGTGHYESIEVTYDPARISYPKLVDVFWHSIDPTQDDGQFCDHGPEYRSVLFYQGEEQHREALRQKAAIEAAHVLKKPIVTQILPASTFWPAEEYHQQFYKKNPEHYNEYRSLCGHDRQLRQVWGDKAAKRTV